MDDESLELADSTKKLGLIRSEMQSLLDSFQCAQIIKDGLPITLCGPPNAGKSSLLNLLVGSDAAIVSPLPGTTRDILRVEMDLNGYLVVLQDTAGLRTTQDIAEQEGVRRARVVAKESPLRIFVVDGSQMLKKTIFESLDETGHGDLVIVVNKVDLISHDEMNQKITELRNAYPQVRRKCYLQSLWKRFWAFPVLTKQGYHNF